MEFSFSYYLSHNILILKLLVYLEFLHVSILNIIRNDLQMRLASPDDSFTFIHLWYFWLEVVILLFKKQQQNLVYFNLQITMYNVLLCILLLTS